MAMKKTSGGDSPLQQGAGKIFWTLPISGRRRRRVTMYFWKIDRVFRFFPLGGIYRRQEMGKVASPLGSAGQALAAPPYGVAGPWAPSISSSVFWKLR
jgi:hypothetical protein